MAYNRTDFNITELSMALQTGMIRQDEYDAAQALAETRQSLAVFSADKVSTEQAEAIVDLVFLVKNRHKSRNDRICLVQQEDLDGFISLVFENGWTSLTPFDSPPPMRTLASPMDLAIEFGQLTADMPLFDMVANTANIPDDIADSPEFAEIQLGDRRVGDHIWIRARPTDSGDPEIRMLDFSYFDRKCRWIRWNKNLCRTNEGWTHQRAMREALRVWDEDQFTRVTGHNLAWAIFYARLRFAHWSWGNPVCNRQSEDHSVFWNLVLMRDNNQGVNSAVAAALDAHQRTPIPHFLPDRVFVLNEEDEDMDHEDEEE